MYTCAMVLLTLDLVCLTFTVHQAIFNHERLVFGVLAFHLMKVELQIGDTKTIPWHHIGLIFHQP